MSAVNQRATRFYLALIIVGALLSAIAGLQAWAHNPIATQSAARTAVLFVALLFFAALYIRCIAATVGRGEAFRFRLRDLLLLAAAVAGFSVAGFALDSLVLGLLVAYAAAFGYPLRNLIHRRLGLQGIPAIGLASAVVLSTFVLTAMAIAVALMQLDWPKDVPYPMTLSLSLWTSAMFAWVFLLGDNARGPMQLVLYGLPVGIPVNIILAFIAGIVSGWLATILSARGGVANRRDS